MDHTESALMKLNQEDFAHLLLDYQGKFNCILDNLKNYFDEFKAKFTKIEADRLIINIERKVLQMNSILGNSKKLILKLNRRKNARTFYRILNPKQ